MEAFSHDPERHQGRRYVFLEATRYDAERFTVSGKGLLLKLKGVDTVEAARALNGLTVQVPTGEIPPSPPESYYHFQILGLRVVTTSGEEVGKVVAIIERLANDVYVVEGQGGSEVLVPAIADVVKAVDLGEGLITVEAVPGLLQA